MTAATTRQIPREMLDPEAALLAAYCLSDTRGRETILELALYMAEDWPAPRPMPSGGA